MNINNNFFLMKKNNLNIYNNGNSLISFEVLSKPRILFQN